MSIVEMVTFQDEIQLVTRLVIYSRLTHAIEYSTFVGRIQDYVQDFTVYHVGSKAF
jgi:hypothetical protein